MKIQACGIRTICPSPPCRRPPATQAPCCRCLTPASTPSRACCACEMPPWTAPPSPSLPVWPCGLSAPPGCIRCWTPRRCRARPRSRDGWTARCGCRPSCAPHPPDPARRCTWTAWTWTGSGRTAGCNCATSPPARCRRRSTGGRWRSMSASARAAESSLCAFPAPACRPMATWHRAAAVGSSTPHCRTHRRCSTGLPPCPCQCRCRTPSPRRRSPARAHCRPAGKAAGRRCWNRRRPAARAPRQRPRCRPACACHSSRTRRPLARH